MTKHQEVYEDLRRRILSGDYAPMSALENETVLCKRYGVSRPTLKKALDHLKQDGLVHSKQGSGTYVNPQEFFEGKNLDTLTERMASSGRAVASVVLLVERVACDDLDEMFHIGRSEELIHYQRVRIVDGAPFAFEDTFMPAYLFEGFDEEVLQGSMIDYIENVCGYEISHDVKTIRPVLPDARMRELLGTGESEPLLEVDHQVYLTRNVMVQYTVEVTTETEVRISSVR